MANVHPLPGAHPNEVSFELGDHRQDVEQQPADRVGRVVYRPAEIELNLALGELVSDRAGVGQRPREAVELGHDERVAGAAGRERLVQAGAFAVGAGEAVVDVDAFGGQAERLQAVALGREVLLVGGDSGVADVQAGHPWTAADQLSGEVVGVLRRHAKAPIRSRNERDWRRDEHGGYEKLVALGGRATLATDRGAQADAQGHRHGREQDGLGVAAAVTAFSSGLGLFLGVLLIAAALLKLRARDQVEVVLVQLLPRNLWRHTDSRRVASVTIAGEAIAGVALLTQPSALAGAVGIIVAILFAAFAGLTWRAMRQRAPCGCFGRADRAASRFDATRAAALLALATALAILRVGADDGAAVSVDLASLLIALAALLLTFGPTVASRFTRRLSKPASVAQEPVHRAGNAGTSRRTFLQKSAATVLGLISLSAIPISATTATADGCPPYQRSCQDQHDLCAGCCGVSQTCRDKCIACYVTCQGGGGTPCTPYVSADGCWPPDS